MMFRKIAAIIFIIALIIVCIGVVVYLVKNQARTKNLQTDKLSMPGEVSESSPRTPASATAGAKPAPTEEQIQQKIEEKKAQIRQEAKGRSYTDDELYFLDFPREAAIKDLTK